LGKLLTRPMKHKTERTRWRKTWCCASGSGGKTSYCLRLIRTENGALADTGTPNPKRFELGWLGLRRPV